ncbi:hypothetical protein K505DRAFT_311454 [Melanomma pulvis-pyrius CBS 109.77]|uniref:Spindle pole body component n=1 Tax=Melanomma pulvis-pyrius CBS 109.77 TaxID=1314802 RepID=A0A6A6X2R5_9PLEO|nr:hypothetical protein K505DRAFT_311454 [Melanomma pulvis-pyrius CBS 109.77]
MAQNAKIGALTDELIRSILQFDPATNRQAYRQAKEIATKGLRAHQYNRTNQFDVQASFAGLDEKFRVLNRDDLADALQSRLQQLQERHNKWMPEYLNLLLLLSDRPTENSDVKALEILRPPSPPPPLTWKEIIADDPYSDEEIWKDIDYAAESSEDERTPKKREKPKPSPATSVEEDDTFDPESCVVPTQLEAVSEIEEAQFWKVQPEEETGKVDITELQTVRETLFMLTGLKTSLYVSDKHNGSIRVNQKYVLGHARAKTTDHLLSQLADIGRDLNRLRQWTQRPSSLSLIQTFEAAVRRRLEDYDRSLALLQRRYLVPDTPVAVSLLAIHTEIRGISGPLLQLAQLVADIEHLLLVNPFIHLEALFERLSLAQMTLEEGVFVFFSGIFFECLQTYLKPIRQWMESGELVTNNETFFVFESDSSSEVSSIWHDRFVLRRGKENALRSPNFLQPAAQKIFNTGKSVVFLKELGIYGFGLDSSEPEPRLDHDTVCGSGSTLLLSPFPELFQSAFETWIRSKYSLASTVLRMHLIKDCGLLNILNEFNILYLGADGSVFQDFADAVFERMDTNQRGWNDRFLLTELARGIFSSVFEKSDAEKIVVRSARSKSQNQSVKGLSGLSIDYALPWSIMNIIQRSSIPVYQQLFTFLLQTYRAKYLLQNITLGAIRAAKDPRLVQLSFKLRQRLIWFADILRSYLTETVILLSNENMVAAMSKAEDIDEMSTIHLRYVARLQEQALLSQNLRPIHKAIISLLDLGVLFSDVHSQDAEAKNKKTTTTAQVPSIPKSPGKALSKSSRRKSVIPAIIEDDSSDSDSADVNDDETNEHKSGSRTGLEAGLKSIDEQFGKLLPFITAGLRSVGRVGVEPIWEMLAERLEWDRKKDR